MSKVSMNNEFQHPLSKALPKTPQGPMRSPARALGWFGIGLGLAQLLMPRRLARFGGAPDVPLLIRALGLREIGVGVGLLTSVDPQPWLWARVAGDALDLATHATGLVTAGRPARTLASLTVLGSIAYLDVLAARGAAPKPGAVGPSPYDYSKRSGFPKPAAEMRGAGLLSPGA